MSILKELQNNIGKEVFLIGGDILQETSRPIVLTKNKRAFIKSLKTEMVESSLIAIHGVITTAKILPKEEIIDTDIFIILENKKESFIIRAQTIKEVIDVVATVLENKDLSLSDLENYNYNLADALFSAVAASIDNIFILYGYEVPLEIKVTTLLKDVIKKSKKIYNKL